MSMGAETLFVGLILSTIMVELTGIYPGGMIVPGYVALYLDQPLRLAGTLIAAILTMLTYRITAHFFILFGRRQFVLLLLVGAVWAMLLQLVLPSLGVNSVAWRTIGWVIPGLLANTLLRQNRVATLLALGVTSVGTFFVVRLLGIVIR